MNISLLMLAARIALAACLYGFLALVLDYAVARRARVGRGASIRAGAVPPASRCARTARRNGVYPLQKDSCFIGRSPSVEVSLADETVSVVHARLWKENGRWWLEDLDSRNGTLLNQIPVVKKSVLCAGDRIRTGRILLEFRLDDSPLPSPEKDSSRDGRAGMTHPSRREAVLLGLAFCFQLFGAAALLLSPSVQAGAWTVYPPYGPSSSHCSSGV